MTIYYLNELGVLQNAVVPITVKQFDSTTTEGRAVACRITANEGFLYSDGKVAPFWIPPARIVKITF